MSGHPEISRLHFWVPRRAAALRDAGLPDARRIALTVVHFPDRRTLQGAANEEEPEQAAEPEQALGCAAGYDPAFLLPFCVQVRSPR